MRYALAAAILATATVANAAGSAPSFKRGTAYQEARTSLQALGWSPAPVANADRYCTVGREDVCERYPETRSCSGTGLANCYFTWRKGDQLIEVTTHGEEVDYLAVFKSECRAGC